jgi:xanthine dehydrogenase molybdopterin-binding subunit B/xanthine dehydrogenase iron-sulfur cluster and FAD-binding subunit A
MVMTLYAALKNNPSSFSASDADELLSGNVCRCTGYDPISQTYKAFAKDAAPDKCCGKKWPSVPLPAALPPFVDPELPQTKALDCESLGVTWQDMRSLQELQALLWRLARQREESDIMLVVGHTSKSLYPNREPKIYINIAPVPELHGCSVGTECVSIGATTPIAEVISVLEGNNLPGPRASNFWKQLAQHGRQSPGGPVRNTASIGGNVMLTHAANGTPFPYEWPMLLEAVAAQINVVQITPDDKPKEIQLKDFQEFYALDLKYSFLKSIIIPAPLEGQVFRSYSTRQRNRFAEAYASAAMSAVIDSGVIVPGSVRLVFNNVAKRPVRFHRLEAALESMQISDPKQEAFNAVLAPLLAEELAQTLESDLYGDEFEGLKPSLFKAFLLKFWLALQPSLPSKLRLAERPWLHFQPIADPKIEYPQYKNADEPIGLPVPKLHGLQQVTAEVDYLQDLPIPPSCLFACPVGATELGKIEKVDLALAREIPGFHDFVDSTYEGFDNTPENFMFNPVETQVDGKRVKIFAQGETSYIGQFIGMILAETPEAAEKCAKAVQVKITDKRPAVVRMDEAINLRRFHGPAPWVSETKCYVPVDRESPEDQTRKADKALAKCEHQLRGLSWTGDQQYHYALEPLSALASPPTQGSIDDGDSSLHMTIVASTGAPPQTRDNVAAALGVVKENIEVKSEQLGGSFGDKGGNITWVAVLAAICAKKSQRPVRFLMSYQDRMTMLNNRSGYRLDYDVGCDKAGRIKVIKGACYVDAGVSVNGVVQILNSVFYNAIDNVYYVPTWDVQTTFLHTDTPVPIEFRSPGWFSAIRFMEQGVIEQVALHLRKKTADIRSINYYWAHPELDLSKTRTPAGYALKDMETKACVDRLMDTSQFAERDTEIKQFNAANKYVKKGLGFTPMKIPVNYFSGEFSFDSWMEVKENGVINVMSGGKEMGQGLLTKVVQVVAHSLQVPMDMITVLKPTTAVVGGQMKGSDGKMHAVTDTTGASFSSELAAYAAQRTCKMIKKKLQPICEQLPETASWQDVVTEAYKQNINLTAHAKDTGVVPNFLTDSKVSYIIGGAAVSEVMLDGLTGQIQVTRTDIAIDMDRSMNPYVDIGQIQGGFVMGLGSMSTELVQRKKEDGSVDYFDYHVPTPWDAPRDWRIELLKSAPNPVKGSVGNKSVGEVPVVLSLSCAMAVDEAIWSLAKDNKDNEQPIKLPSVSRRTLDVRQALCRHVLQIASPSNGSGPEGQIVELVGREEKAETVCHTGRDRKWFLCGRKLRT